MKKLLYNQQNVKWCDFDIMKNEQLSFWECEFLNESENWTKSLAARYKLCSIPLEAKNISLGQKRKRGRVAKAKKALIVQ
ncbi:unnamed protein product [Rotaria magnacalcarata]|nr:unnamed protein product [Rotaria magnacalcarata]